MHRLVDAVWLQFGVNGLGEAGFYKADRLRAFDLEQPFKICRREMLHHGVMLEVRQNFLAAGIRNVGGDQNEMQLAFVAAQGVAAHQQPARFQNEVEQTFNGFNGKFVTHGIALFELKLFIQASSQTRMSGRATPRRIWLARRCISTSRRSFSSMGRAAAALRLRALPWKISPARVAGDDAFTG